MKGELGRVCWQEVPERASQWRAGCPHLPQQQDDEPEQQQPGAHSHEHQPQLDLGRQLLHQLGVDVHGELEGREGAQPVSVP